MQKGQWNSAIKISKKAKDRSIYNFIKWRHLLTTGNQESFFDYQVFINENSDYPRMDRLRYLAEHKLSTEKVSPRKILNEYKKIKIENKSKNVVIGFGITEKTIKKEVSHSLLKNYAGSVFFDLEKNFGEKDFIIKNIK